MRYAAILALATTCIAACAPAELTHFDNSTFDPVLKVELPNTAWLAIDSCATGVHALVEMELSQGPRAEILEQRLKPSRPLPLRLEYGDGYSADMHYGRLEGPICTSNALWTDRYNRPTPGVQEKTCVYYYSAQFKLRHLPDASQDFQLHYNGRTVLLAQK